MSHANDDPQRSTLDEQDDEIGAQVQVEQVQVEPAADVAADPRERFREALERKNATPGAHPGSHASGASNLKGSNGKRKREFRRKSG